MARILIMEDEPNIVFILKEIFAEHGHEVITAQDGSLGMQKLEEGLAPDVVLLDYRLPSINGKKVIERMNESDSLRFIPRIIMSGSIPKSEDSPSKESYQAFISKPFDLFEVVKIVENCINPDKNNYKLA